MKYIANPLKYLKDSQRRT